MRILINRQGRQLGPYSLDEARDLVRAGRLDPADWAWPDGATQWVPLREVTGLSDLANAPPATPPAPVTGEEQLWSGRPSQILNFRLYFIWTIILLGVLAATCVRLELSPVLVLLWAWALVQIILRNLRLYAIEYVVTTQRVRIVSGLFGKNIQEIELFRVKDTMVRQSFFQRLFGLGTITVLSGDAQQPRLVLQGIPHAIDLRERLRQEVMILRQRYGVRELDMM
jgi:membrane protein YdbS with pleckstrin-like domain